MKNFLLQNVVLLADIFPVLWQFFQSSQRAREGGRAALAAEGGEIRSSYFKNSAHSRISQAFRLAASRLGGEIERDFPADIFDFVCKRKFFIIINQYTKV